MLFLHLLFNLLPESGSLKLDAQPYSVILLVASITGLSGWFAARHTARAPLQQAVNDALRLLMEEMQSQLARASAHASELERTVKDREAEVVRLRGEARQMQQINHSYVRLLLRNGIDVDLDTLLKQETDHE